MNATVNVLCYKSKTLSNGEHPLMIRVCKDGKKKYVSLGISVKPQYWDFEKNRPKRNCPNKEQINTLIKEQEQKYSEQILDFSSRNKSYTLTTLVETVDSSVKAKTVNGLFIEYIEQLKKENRIGYALSVRQVYSSLVKFNGHLDIYFQEIDVNWLKNYEFWLRGQKLAENTIGIRLRTLRVVYNLAVTEGLVKSDNYPFRKYKVSRLHTITAKRAITKEQVKQIMSYNTDSSCFYKKLAVDMFAFSYLMGGINFTDMSLLTNDNIDNDRLIYIRQKTKKTIILPLSEQAKEIINKYSFAFQKKFGQNFLIDTTVLDRIISSAEITKEDCVLEIGPGIGTMTQYLAERAGSVVAVEDLFRAVWSEDFMPGSNNTVMVHIRHLREKIGDDAQKPRFIKNVWGVGYIIE